MKKSILIILITIFIGVTVYSFGGRNYSGRGGMGNHHFGFWSNNEETKIVEFVDKLKSKYNIKKSENLKASEVTVQELEDLGKILMESRVEDNTHLKYMQDRMGGEGSELLTESYKTMGANYLDGYGMGYGGYMRERGRKSGFFGGRGWCFFGDKDDDAFTGRDSALELLKVRYANGEITKKEYVEMKELLEK